MNMTNVLIQIS